MALRNHSPQFHLWLHIPIIWHTHTDVGTNVGRVADDIPFVVIDVAITPDITIREADGCTLMAWEMHKMYVKVQEVTHKESKEYGTSFSVILLVTNLPLLLLDLGLHYTHLFLLPYHLHNLVDSHQCMISSSFQHKD